MYSPDVIIHGYHGIGRGIDNIRGFYRALSSALPDGRIELKDVVGEGNKVACRFVFTGTHKGTLNGVPPTGININLMGSNILRFDNGKCVERWSQSNYLWILRQLESSRRRGS
jgi:predicted ester cyclase